MAESKAVLVSGGAGYIGSHVVRALRRRGRRVVVLDSLRTGHRAAVEEGLLVEGDVADQELVKRLVGEHDVGAVLHFAAEILVGESVVDPRKYFHDNTFKTFLFLNALLDAGVRRFVFSSTAAIFGDPVRTPIEEDDPKAPASPYGESKLMVERMLATYDRAYGLRYTALRYFNAAGADPAGDLGEDHHPETHLIPLALQVALGRREELQIYGADYPTPDGTCVRDYVHVVDLAEAHLLALDYLEGGGCSRSYNLGNGTGYSVREVLESARRVTGAEIPARVAARRPGDPAVLVAGSERIRRELGWRPEYTDLDAIVASAWRWHRAHPEGFAESR
jgi:UDP-glucose 4-epimerase